MPNPGYRTWCLGDQTDQVRPAVLTVCNQALFLSIRPKGQLNDEQRPKVRLQKPVIAPASSFVSTITIHDDARLVALHGQLCSRIARLLREQRQLYQAWQEDVLQQAMNDALDALSETWGVGL